MAAQGPQNTLRNKQIAALKRMLNFNAPLSKTASAKEPTWKVLIYDKQGSDIISPLLTVKDLRNLGVTLHLLIDAPREQIADATALYFVMPTKDNVTKICQDCRLQLYEAYHFNFITPISRTLLEDLAKGALETNCVTQISKVYDQYLHFITLEEDLFIVNAQRSDELSYYALNRPDSLDTDMKQICDTLVETLFSVFVTAGVVPIIQCPRGNAAEMVAEALDKRLRDNIKDARSSMFSGDNLSFTQLSFSRPLLVILDRNVDLATMLHHTWTYQALGHDVLEMSLNRVTLPPDPTPEGASVAKPPNKTFDLLISDRFWQLHRGSPFPTVADAIQVEVNDYKTSEEKLMRLKAAMSTPDEEGMDSDGASGMLVDNTAKLTSAISSLPELLERKKSIDLHTNIATALLNQIKERKLDLFFEMEDKLITKSSLDKSVLDVISDPSAGTAEDKLRLFVIYYTLSPDVSDDYLAPYTTALETVGADVSSLAYLKQWKPPQKPMASHGLSFLVHPEGPKLRAKISHGELCVPQAFANHVLCMAIAFCAQYTLQSELTMSAVVSRCLAVEEQYVSLFHPISLLKKELLQLVTNLDQWKQITDSPDEHSTTTDQARSSVDAIISHVLQSAQHLEESQIKTLLVKGTTLTPLQDLITLLWQRPLNTLYIPKADLEVVGLLRSIVLNASRSTCQVTMTAGERSGQLKRMELRARQRSNYDRLLSSVAVYHQAMVVVVLSMCESVSHLPLDSGCDQGHIKFLKKVLQFSENFNSLTSPAKNRWAEATTLCHTLFDLDTRHMTSHMTRHQTHD